MQTCKHCGAVLSRHKLAFEDIIGQEHAKRALEVALAGGHTIAFFGNGDATALAEWATSHGLTTWAVQTCPCGWFGFQGRECTCSLSQVAKWQKRKAHQNACNAEITIECSPPHSGQVERYLNGQRGEPEAAMLDRVQQRGSRPDGPLDQASKSLLKACIQQMALSPERTRSMMAVAQTIAGLAHSVRVETHHLAEAIQYRPRL